jgi:probable addiction module antidote protein
MAKKRTSKKQKPSSVNRPEFVTLKSGVKTQAWHPTAELLDEGKLARALFEALKDEDIDSFKEILAAHLEAKVKTKEAKTHGLSERTMYEALSQKGNPSLKTIAKIVKMACAS